MNEGETSPKGCSSDKLASDEQSSGIEMKNFPFEKAATFEKNVAVEEMIDTTSKRQRLQTSKTVQFKMTIDENKKP